MIVWLYIAVGFVFGAIVGASGGVLVMAALQLGRESGPPSESRP